MPALWSTAGPLPLKIPGGILWRGSSKLVSPIGIADDISIKHDYSRTFTDQVGIIATQTFAQGFNRLAVDPLGIIDTASWTLVSPAVFDTVGAAPYSTTTSATSVNGSFSYTATAGAAVIMWVAVDTNSTSKAASYTRTATYGTQVGGPSLAMTSLGAVDANNGSHGWLEGFRLLNAPGGAQTVNISITGASTTFYCVVANAESWNGVNSIGPVVTSFGTGNMSSGAVTSAANQMVAQAFYDQNIGSTATGISAYNQTQRYNTTIHNGTTAYLSLAFGDAPGAASVNFTGTNSNVNLSWSSIAAPLIP